LIALNSVRLTKENHPFLLYSTRSMKTWISSRLARCRRYQNLGLLSKLTLLVLPYNRASHQLYECQRHDTLPSRFLYQFNDATSPKMCRIRTFTCPRYCHNSTILSLPDHNDTCTYTINCNMLVSCATRVFPQQLPTMIAFCYACHRAFYSMQHNESLTQADWLRLLDMTSTSGGGLLDGQINICLTGS
jgi:hypothetical protein